MNILIINHYAGSPDYGMDFRPYYFAREWVNNGHAVRIVAASFSHLRYHQPASTDIITHQRKGNIEYCWIQTPEYHGNGIRRVINIMVFLFRLVKYRREILHRFTPETVIAASTYPFDNIIAHSIARQYHAKHIYEVHDLWPLSLIEIGGMPRWHPFILLLGWAERYSYKKADSVICTLPLAEPHMRSLGLGEKKFIAIPNGIDIDPGGGHVSRLPEFHRELLRGLRGEDKIIVGYAGGHALSNALDTLVRSAVYIADKKIAIVLVGDGTEKPQLQKLAADLHLQNVFFLPPVPKDCVNGLLSLMDVLYIGWQRRSIYRYGVSSTKLMDYMLASKPVIHSNDVGNDIVAESGCGVSIPPEDPIALGEAITAIASMTQEARNSLGLKGREFVVRHHDNIHIARTVLDCCSRIPSTHH